MYASKIIAALFAATLAVTMTMPVAPQQELADEITFEGESPLVARIGVVADIVESNNITVRISGSETLVQASYLFPQYEPLIGDYVYVVKQDAQWLVLGPTAGPLNTVISNPSFENGTISTTPDDWTVSVVSNVAGTPTFRKEAAQTPSGRYIGVFRNSSAGVAGTSTIDIFSDTASANENQVWAIGYFLIYAALDLNASLVPQGGFTDINAAIRFLDAGGALLQQTTASYMPLYASHTTSPDYIRTYTVPDGFYSVQAPPGTAFVQARIRVSFTMHVNSASEVGIDAVLLRGVEAP